MYHVVHFMLSAVSLLTAFFCSVVTLAIRVRRRGFENDICYRALCWILLPIFPASLFWRRCSRTPPCNYRSCRRHLWCRFRCCRRSRTRTTARGLRTDTLPQSLVLALSYDIFTLLPVWATAIRAFHTLTIWPFISPTKEQIEITIRNYGGDYFTCTPINQWFSSYWCSSNLRNDVAG